MSLTVRLVALCAALALAGCSSNFGKGGVSGNGTGSGSGVGGYGSGGVSTGALDPASVAYFQQSVGDHVLFSVDESSLTAAARATLTEQAHWLSKNGGYSAVIEGHADEQGTREYNLALGARRANAVQEFLISQGVAPNRLRTVSYGKERPIEICSEESCYAQNRRAVTVLSAGANS